MLIQSINNAQQTAPPTGSVSSDAPKIVSTGAPQPQNGKAEQPTTAQLNDAVKTANQTIKQSGQALEFSVDSQTKTPIVQLKDTSTGEVIRQFPTEEAMAMARVIDKFQHGQLLTQKA